MIAKKYDKPPKMGPPKCWQIAFINGDTVSDQPKIVQENITQCRSERTRLGMFKNEDVHQATWALNRGRLEFVSPTKLPFETKNTADIDLL